MAIDIKAKLARYTAGKREKEPWNIHFQILAEYFLTRKADFTVSQTPGAFLNKDIYDSTGPKSAKVMAGAMLGMLWPEGNQNFMLEPARGISNSKENKEYFDRISNILFEDMTDPAAGLALTLGEYMLEDVIFGTSGIGVFDGEENDTIFLFQPWDIKSIVIFEGANGMVEGEYYETEMTVRQAAVKFGEKNLSKKTQELFKKAKYEDKIKILHIIEPRLDTVPDKLGSQNMKYESCYLELDPEHLIKESGFDEQPVFVGRMAKHLREKYGRSPAMDALPDVLELNILREGEIVAIEKILDPPMGVLDDGKLGASTIDTSAGAINVFNVTGRVSNQQPIFPLYTVGDVRSTKDRIEELKLSVADHFMIDRLLDLNNETEMTLGEAQMRNRLRAMVLGSLFSRQITEVFSPMVKRCFNIELKKGRFGVVRGSAQHNQAKARGEDVLVIPDEVAKRMLSGGDVYKIVYLTPAARMVQSETADGILNTWKFMNDVAQSQPEVYDNVDEDKSVKILAPLLGAPREIMRDDQTIKLIRDVRAEATAQKEQQAQALEEAKILSKLKPSPALAGVQSDVSQPLGA